MYRKRPHFISRSRPVLSVVAASQSVPAVAPLVGLLSGIALLLLTTACVSHKPSARPKPARAKTEISQTDLLGQAASQQQPASAVRRMVPKRVLLSDDDVSSVDRIVLSLSTEQQADDQGRESKSTIEFDHDKKTARYERRWKNPSDKTSGVYCTKPLSNADYERLLAALKKAKLASFPDEEEPDPDPANCLTLISTGRAPQIYSFAEVGRRTRCASESLAILGGAPILKMANTWKCR